VAVVKKITALFYSQLKLIIMKSKVIYVHLHFTQIDVYIKFLFFYEATELKYYSNFLYSAKILFQKHVYIPASLTFNFDIPHYYSSFSERYIIKRYFNTQAYRNLIQRIYTDYEGSSKTINFDIVDNGAFLVKTTSINPFIDINKRVSR
jgi:hypothetical protein